MNVNILAVDDEEYNLEILAEWLDDANYNVDTAENGQIAKDMLLAEPTKYHAVLLDRMMPVMNGLQVLKFIKSNPQLRFIPVIMQTAKATRDDVQDGLDAGVLYYLTKPFEKNSLLNIIETAIASFKDSTYLRGSIDEQPCKAKAIGKRNFTYSSLDEARGIATLLASICPDPKKVVTGLCELLINAVEHGNLEVGYEQKAILLARGQWLDEIERRLQLPEFKDRKVSVDLDDNGSEIRFNIKDQGNGFDAEEYMKINPLRVEKVNGRGITIAKSVSFDFMEYTGSGSEVTAIVLRRQKKIA